MASTFSDQKISARAVITVVVLSLALVVAAIALIGGSQPVEVNGAAQASLAQQQPEEPATTSVPEKSSDKTPALAPRQPAGEVPPGFEPDFDPIGEQGEGILVTDDKVNDVPDAPLNERARLTTEDLMSMTLDEQLGVIERTYSDNKLRLDLDSLLVSASFRKPIPLDIFRRDFLAHRGMSNARFTLYADVGGVPVMARAASDVDLAVQQMNQVIEQPEFRKSLPENAVASTKDLSPNIVVLGITLSVSEYRQSTVWLEAALREKPAVLVNEQVAHVVLLSDSVSEASIADWKEWYTTK